MTAIPLYSFKTITSHVSSKRDIYGSNERRNILIRVTDDLLKENGVVYYEGRKYQNGEKIDIFTKVIQDFENKFFFEMVISYNSYTCKYYFIYFYIFK